MRVHTWAQIGLALAIGCAGLLMVHRPTIFSGFRWLPNSPIDGRLIHYLLEHGYRWVIGQPGHKSLWDPPFFYPARNAAAYTDLLLSLGPVYWLWRGMGASPDLSFGIWMVSMSALNYLAGLLLFRKGLELDMLPASLGAFLVAFGAPRVNQAGHEQLRPCFYVLLAVFALTRLFRSRSPSRLKRWAYWILASAGLILQLYGGFYLAWFLIVGAALTALGALVLSSCRWRFLETVWRDLGMILLVGAAGLLLIVPFLLHYVPVAREVKPDLQFCRTLHPSFSSWFNMGEGNWLWGWTVKQGLVASVGPTSDEHNLGIGLWTTLTCVLGYYLNWERRTCRLAALVAFAILASTTCMPQYEIVSIATGACAFCLAGLYRAIDEPQPRAAGLAVFVGILLIIRFPNLYLQALSLGVMVLCLVEMARVQETPRLMVIPGLAIGVLCLRFFDVEASVILACWMAAVAGLLAYYLKWHRREIGLGALAAFILSLSLVTYWRQTGVWIGGLAAAPIGLAATSARWVRLPPRVMVWTLTIALAIIVVYYSSDSLWLRFYGSIPGGIAIRAVGRVVLILLIPAALGVALLVERLQHGVWRAASWVVALGCMLEQGVTIPTRDPGEDREAVAAIVAQVDPDCEAFYYHLCDELHFSQSHVDAMWASMLTGKPTINGYSGYYPSGWDVFSRVDAPRGPDIETALAEWMSTQGLVSARIQVIESKCSGRAGNVLPAPGANGTSNEKPCPLGIERQRQPDTQSPPAAYTQSLPS
jgi:hypothetical protein